jgi:hypothetical protein
VGPGRCHDFFRFGTYGAPQPWTTSPTLRSRRPDPVFNHSEANAGRQLAHGPGTGARTRSAVDDNHDRPRRWCHRVDRRRGGEGAPRTIGHPEGSRAVPGADDQHALDDPDDLPVAHHEPDDQPARDDPDDHPPAYDDHDPAGGDVGGDVEVTSVDPLHPEELHRGPVSPKMTAVPKAGAR